jgi:hypothetical protein
MPAAEAGAEAPAAEESPLLAVPPGSRKAPRLHQGPNSNSSKIYHPKKVDRRDSGARLRSTRSQYASEKGSSTMRNILPGYADGLKSLGKGFVPQAEGVYEQEESIYNLSEQTEEAKLFQLNDSIRNLLESLENTNEVLTEHQDEN